VNRRLTGMTEGGGDTGPLRIGFGISPKVRGDEAIFFGEVGLRRSDIMASMGNLYYRLLSKDCGALWPGTAAEVEN
jgi:hypothetical protein